MKYPNLVPKRLCKTPIKVIIYGEGLNEDGSPIKQAEKELLCNYQDGGKRIFTAEQKIVDIEGTALLNGDAFPDITNLTGGKVIVNSISRRIAYGKKHRNPDGTVNYIELRLV